MGKHTCIISLSSNLHDFVCIRHVVQNYIRPSLLLTQGQYDWLEGQTRDYFFHVIAGQDPGPHFHLLFEALKELTENGKNVSDVEHSIGPLLLKWIQHPILSTVIADDRKDGTAGVVDSGFVASPIFRNRDSGQIPDNVGSNVAASDAALTTPTNAGWSLDDVLVEFLSLLINVLKFNSAYLEEATVAGMSLCLVIHAQSTVEGP